MRATAGDRISGVFAKQDARRGIALTRRSRWLGLTAFTAFLVAGALIRMPFDAALAIPGFVIAIAGAAMVFVVTSGFVLLFAVISTVGVAMVVSDASGSGNVGWFTVCITAAWCVLAGGVPIGVAYWVASLLLFGAEWLVVVREPGWASWIAGTTLSALAAAMIAHQLVLMERLRQAQETLVEQSRAEERNRIARELHDIIAHSLTVSLLHISSARLAMDDDPAEAAHALAEAERLGRQSLDEVRATMNIAGSGRSHGVNPPAPGISDLARLVEQMNDAGAKVRLDVDAALEREPATTGSTVYRIVQEALTNAAKHAPGAAVTVRVTVRDGSVDLSVDSTGSPGHGFGMGLASMRQRAEAVGGICNAGPGGGGWLVQASLPLRTQPAGGGETR
jgi:signal transduction histidine kinase